MRQLLNHIQSLAIRLNAPILAMCAFTVPVSSSLKSFFFPWVVLNLLFIPTYRQQLKTIFNNRLAVWSMILFGVVLLGVTYSPATFDERWLVVSKYLKLLYFPILLIAFQEEKAKTWAMHGFLFAMLLTSIVGIFGHFGYLHALLPDPDHVFRNHIIIGFMIAYAAFLSLRWFLVTKSNKRWFYLLCLMIFTYEMFFINGGRMSYLLFIMLFIYGCCYHLSRLQAAIGFMVIVGIVGSAYLGSEAFKTRIHDTTRELTLFKKDDANTSLGYRVQFQSFAYQLWQKHPVIGNGTGSFTYYFRTLKPVPSWQGGLLEPHNQYWLFAVEHGVIGLLVLLGFFLVTYQASLTRKTYGVSYRALMYAFLLGNMTDSLLFYSGPGYFFILMAALCLAKTSSCSPDACGRESAVA